MAKTQLQTIEKAVVNRKKGLTAPEIAQKFDFNPGSVRTQIGRLIKLRAITAADFKRVDPTTGRKNTVYVGR